MLGGVIFEAAFGSGGGRLACGLDFATVKGLGKIEGLGLGLEKVVAVAAGGVGNYCPATFMTHDINSDRRHFFGLIFMCGGIKMSIFYNAVTFHFGSSFLAG